MSSLSVQIPSNFGNLALFICHLFVDGHFQFSHILYDPNEFDDSLLIEIDSICPIQIPWQTININQTSFQNSPSNDRTDHILQLIFFDPKLLGEQIIQNQEHLTFYRIFIFSEMTWVHENETEKRISLIEKLSSVFDSNSLIVRNNLSSGSIRVRLLRESDKIDLKQMHQNMNLIYKTKTDIEQSQLFDEIFGWYEQSIIIETMFWFRRIEDSTRFESIIPFFGDAYTINYLSSTLNVSKIDVKCMVFNNSTDPILSQSIKHTPKNYRSDLMLQYKAIPNDKS